MWPLVPRLVRPPGPGLRRSCWGRSSTWRVTVYRTRTSARGASRFAAAWQPSRSSPSAAARWIRRRSVPGQAPHPIWSTFFRSCVQEAASSSTAAAAGTDRAGSPQTYSCCWPGRFSGHSSRRDQFVVDAGETRSRRRRLGRRTDVTLLARATDDRRGDSRGAGYDPTDATDESRHNLHRPALAISQQS